MTNIFEKHLFLKTLKEFSKATKTLQTFLRPHLSQNVFKVSKLLTIFTSSSLTLVVIMWLFWRTGSHLSGARVFCGRYEDFLWGDGKLTRKLWKLLKNKYFSKIYATFCWCWELDGNITEITQNFAAIFKLFKNKYFSKTFFIFESLTLNFWKLLKILQTF